MEEAAQTIKSIDVNTSTNHSLIADRGVGQVLSQLQLCKFPLSICCRGEKDAQITDFASLSLVAFIEDTMQLFSNCAHVDLSKRPASSYEPLGEPFINSDIFRDELQARLEKISFLSSLYIHKNA